MPHLESRTGFFAKAKAFRTLDLLQGYWQTSLSLEAQALFIMVTNDCLFTPTRVAQVIFNAMVYFQCVMQEVLEGLIEIMCLVWVDNRVIERHTVEELVRRL